MNFFYAQLNETAEAVGGVLENRGDSFVASVAILIASGLLVWIMWNLHKASNERDDRNQERDDKNNEFHRQLALKNSEQLGMIANAIESTSKAVEGTSKAMDVIASTSDRTEKHLEAMIESHERLHRQHDKNAMAIARVIDAAEANRRGDEAEAFESIRSARESLLRKG